MFMHKIFTPILILSLSAGFSFGQVAPNYFQNINPTVLAQINRTPTLIEHFEVKCDENNRLSASWRIKNSEAKPRFVIEVSADGVHWEDLICVSHDLLPEAAKIFSITNLKKKKEHSYFRLKAMNGLEVIDYSLPASAL